jgi:hypothetical protein
VLAAVALVTLVLASGLRPDAFFVGDPGVKLIAARHALAHPSHPLDIALPVIGGDPAPFVDPFFVVHGGHSHAITSELFPVLTAPFLAVAGLRGLYVLPALGFLLAIAGSGWIATALDPRRNAALVAAVAALTTPLLFYGLEFWEHTLAVGLGTIGAGLLITSARAPGRAAPAGLLFGIATLLRPEAAWFAIAVGTASWLLPARPRAGAFLAAAACAAAPIAVFAAYAIVHFGSIAPPHVSANAGALNHGWLSSRLAIVSTWFVRDSTVNFWRAAPGIVFAAVPLVQGPRRAGTWFLVSVAMATASLVVLSAPNDGGGQWGPRYLLFAYIPLAVLVADALDASRWRRAVAMGLAVAVFSAGAWSQRSAYRQLRGTKRTYGRIVDFVAAMAPPSGYIVTDLWWLDQVSAAAAGEPRVLYAAGDERAAAALGQLSDAGIRSVTAMRTRDDADGVAAWTSGTCFDVRGREELDVRGLVAYRVGCGASLPARGR